MNHLHHGDIRKSRCTTGVKKSSGTVLLKKRNTTGL